MQFVENPNKNAEIFIKYFVDEVIIDPNGNKIQKYAIVDSKQQRWNFSAILSIMMQYKQVEQKISAQQEIILTAQKALKNHLDQMASILEAYDMIVEALATVLTKQ